jgi:hypothetical protein
LPPKADIHLAVCRVRFGPLHSISSSASAKKLSGIFIPSDLAVFALMTNSNLVGCITGTHDKSTSSKAKIKIDPEGAYRIETAAPCLSLILRELDGSRRCRNPSARSFRNHQGSAALFGRKLTMHGLGDDKAEVVGETVGKPLTPMPGKIGMTERGLHPDFAVTQFDREDRYVVCPKIKGAAAFQIEAGVVPMTGQDAVLDAAPLQREAHMRATIVEGEDAAAVLDDKDRSMVAV